MIIYSLIPGVAQDLFLHVSLIAHVFDAYKVSLMHKGLK
jgi:hypothetical protein